MRVIATVITRVRRFLPVGRSGQSQQPSQKVVLRAVSHSIRKYGKTYRLLERYDQVAPGRAEDLARPQVVQKYIRRISN